MLLDAQSDIEVVGEAADGLEVSQRARELRPDVVLLDLSMPGPRSGNVIRTILETCPTTRVLILTMHDDAAYLRAALSAGAAGYVVKKVADSELLSAIRAVHAGRRFVDLTRTPHLAAPSSQPSDLSRRERDVLRLLAQGNSNQQIAENLAISVKTVETHRARLSKKLRLKGRAELYRFAAESGLLDGDPLMSAADETQGSA